MGIWVFIVIVTSFKFLKQPRLEFRLYGESATVAPPHSWLWLLGTRMFGDSVPPRGCRLKISEACGLIGLNHNDTVGFRA